MFLNAIVIVAREVIESALVACLLIALVHIRGLPGRSVLWGFGLGAVLATLYGSSVHIITPWLDYRGQEVLIVTVHVLMVGLILALLLKDTHGPLRHDRCACWLITLLLGLSLTLEISEIGIYVSAYSDKAELLTSAVLGSLIGAGIGVSLAVLGFYTLMRLRADTSARVIHALFALLIGGLLSQCVQILSQVDILPGQAPVWDTSSNLSETSIPGQLLVAVFRYEARPTWLQVLLYAGGAALAVWLWLLRPGASVSKQRRLE